MLPSGWHCLGMIKHLALSDEHYWFRSVVGGESFDFRPEGENDDWRVGPGESAEDVFALYRQEIERANEVIIGFLDLRFIMLHVIKETAGDAGHLDAVGNSSMAVSGSCSDRRG